MQPPTHNEPHSNGDVAVLPPTRWSMVARACDREGETWLADIASITLIYRPVLVRYLILRLRVSPDRAEDIVQAFLLEKLMDQNVLLKASQRRGRFRSFIIKVFSNYAVGQLRGQLALKSRPSSPEAERLDDLPELRSGDTPLADSFDALWARQVLARTLDRIREECLSKDRQVLWKVLEARILVPILDNSPPISYEELVVRFGLRSPSEASNMLITAKRMFARVLREVVRETVADDKDVDTEIRELKRVLAK